MVDSFHDGTVSIWLYGVGLDYVLLPVLWPIATGRAGRVAYITFNVGHTRKSQNYAPIVFCRRYRDSINAV